MDREVKSFTDKQKLRVQYHQTSFTTNATGLTWSGNTREEKDLQKQTPIKKMAIEAYISIITVNVNG